MIQKVHSFIVAEGKKNKPSGATNKLSSNDISIIQDFLYANNTPSELFIQITRDLKVSKYHLYDCLGMHYSIEYNNKEIDKIINRLVFFFIVGHCSETGFMNAMYIKEYVDTSDDNILDFLKKV